MKKSFKTLVVFVCLIFSVLSTNSVFAQKQESQDTKFSKENIESMKIAFFTKELNLSCEEAEKFWPVYNLCEKERWKARNTTINSMRELSKAIKEEGKKDDEIKIITEKYYNNLLKETELSKEHYLKYLKVLPTKKAAMVRIVEEKFFRDLVKQYRNGKRR